MIIDLAWVLYIENAIITAGVFLAIINRTGKTLLEVMDGPEPAWFYLFFFGVAFWPAAWACGAVLGIARAIKHASKQPAA